jgi:hypothetical protein
MQIKPCLQRPLSRPNVLLGMHGYHRHWGYLFTLRGRASAGFYDACHMAPTCRTSRFRPELRRRRCSHAQ